MAINQRRNGESISQATVGYLSPEFGSTDMIWTPQVIPLCTLVVLTSAYHLRRFQAV